MFFDVQHDSSANLRVQKRLRQLTRQNLSTECHRFDYCIIAVACCDTKADDIEKIMTADNIRFPLIVTGELNRAFLRF